MSFLAIVAAVAVIGITAGVIRAVMTGRTAQAIPTKRSNLVTSVPGPLVPQASHEMSFEGLLASDTRQGRWLRQENQLNTQAGHRISVYHCNRQVVIVVAESRNATQVWRYVYSQTNGLVGRQEARIGGAGPIDVNQARIVSTQGMRTVRPAAEQALVAVLAAAYKPA